jgi:hypothetical protein
MRTRVLLAIIGLCFIAPGLMIGGCSKKSTNPPPGEETGFYIMRQYFPLDEGDQWTWEVTFFEVAEEYVDGDSSLGEPFTDLNGNGIWDYEEQFQDSNFNGKYDGPYDPWSPGIPYADRNSNGQYDAPNGMWELGERFLDLDDNGVCNKANKLELRDSIPTVDPQDSVITRQGGFAGTYSDGTPGTMAGETNAFSNDTVGLRWHGHGDYTSWYDLIAPGEPIVIARDTMRLGDSVLTEGQYGWSWTSWLSILEGVESVTVPAGTFVNCLRFKSIAVDWDENMEKYNGVSYQWYAKDVGLVKWTGPEQNQYWTLTSAHVAGKTYP